MDVSLSFFIMVALLIMLRLMTVDMCHGVQLDLKRNF